MPTAPRMATVALILSLAAHAAWGVDTLRVMHYNLLYYDGVSSFCTATNNNVEAKDQHLAVIIEYFRPHIFTANEIDGRLASVDRVLTRVLNRHGGATYRRAHFTGQHLVNMLFFDATRLGLKSQAYIPTSPRVTDVYTLYLLTEGLAWGDTTFITCIVTHLKAGQTDADAQTRHAAAQQIMAFIGHRNIAGNVLLMGDLNVYTASEPAFQTLTSPAANGLYFADPIDALGHWHNNPAFAAHHTQSTRVDGGCFAGGGMDDRFDFILASPPVLEPQGIDYVEGSYRALGQDGNRFNSTLIEPANASVPAAVLHALHGMSDHLPVTLKLVHRPTSDVGNAADSWRSQGVQVFNPAHGAVEVLASGASAQRVRVEIYNLLGHRVFTATLHLQAGVRSPIPATGLAPGFYLLRLQGDGVSLTAPVVKR